MAEVVNAVVLSTAAVLVIAAMHVYSITGWPCPGLIDKTEGRG